MSSSAASSWSEGVCVVTQGLEQQTQVNKVLQLWECNFVDGFSRQMVLSITIELSLYNIILVHISLHGHCTEWPLWKVATWSQ